jgi:cytochrome bd-type quinol oxidase subunit 1
MSDAIVAGRAQFAFTVMFHYLFPMLTMGLGTITRFRGMTASALG